MTFQREDIIWAAGLFEGEGCITPGNRKSLTQRPRWRLALGMTDKDVVDRFASIVKFGAIYPLKRDADSKWKDIWYWETGNRAHVYAILAALYPWLGVRRRARATQAMNDLIAPPPVRKCRRGHLRTEDNVDANHRCKACRRKT